MDLNSRDGDVAEWPVRIGRDVSRGIEPAMRTCLKNSDTERELASMRLARTFRKADISCSRDESPFPMCGKGMIVQTRRVM